MSALGFYEALSHLGPPPNIKYFHDYDWDKETKQPRVAILPDARELTESQIHSLHTFIEHGNTLLITGLTGFYGPHATAWPLTGFPLAEITGGQLKEVYLRGKTPLVSLTTPFDAVLPSRLWISTIDPSSATAIGKQNGEVIGTEREITGGGRVIWIPSPIDLGAWLTDAQPLARYLQASLKAVQSAPFTMLQPENSCILRVLENQGSYLTVLTNGAETSKKCEIKTPLGLRATTLWGPMGQSSTSESIYTLEPQGTSVQLWR
jgi:hypothetical protein